MKKIVTLIIGIIIFYSSNSQNKVVVFKIVSLQNEVVLLYENDITVFSNYVVTIRDSAKVTKLKTKEMKEIIFFSKNGKDYQVSFQNALASSVPSNRLYVHILSKNKLHLGKASSFVCSRELIQEIRNIVGK